VSWIEARASGSTFERMFEPSYTRRRRPGWEILRQGFLDERAHSRLASAELGR
jgi:hypothetical protein